MSGLNTVLTKENPITMNCGDEEITIMLAKRTSLNSKTLNIVASKKVGITSSHTYMVMKQMIADLKLHLDGLANYKDGDMKDYINKIYSARIYLEGLK